MRLNELRLLVIVAALAIWSGTARAQVPGVPVETPDHYPFGSPGGTWHPIQAQTCAPGAACSQQVSSAPLANRETCVDGSVIARQPDGSWKYEKEAAVKQLAGPAVPTVAVATCTGSTCSQSNYATGYFAPTERAAVPRFRGAATVAPPVYYSGGLPSNCPNGNCPLQQR